MRDRLRIIEGDALTQLRLLPEESVQCCVTSPPYWNLRDYGVAGQLGGEATLGEYLKKLTAVFAEVKRVLRRDGTCWVNMGDAYNSTNKWGGGGNTGKQTTAEDGSIPSFACRKRKSPIQGTKPKDLIGLPWRLAFALQEDGWYLRSDIIWNKPNPMPESVTDRPTRSHEYLFLLTKTARYFYNADAIREPASEALIKQVEEGYSGESLKDFGTAKAQDASGTKRRIIEGCRKRIDKQRGHSRTHAGFNGRWDKLTKEEQAALGRNKRDVWTVSPAPFHGSHFATYPPELIKPCILAGSRAGDVVLDPFGGSGTTGMVALELGRRALLIELNPEYIALIRQRTDVTAGLGL